MNANISATGTIHKARTSFTVVAIARDSAPYVPAAPTTELVSWIAIAAHTPNCPWVSPKAFPISGNTNKAIALSTKTVPRATDISSASASIVGPTAAIALPPQIAVPDEIRAEVLAYTHSHLPTRYPSASVPKMVAIVKRIPSLPAL